MGPSLYSFRGEESYWLPHSSAVLAKNVTAFCPRPKNLSAAELKSFGFMALTEEISRHTSFVAINDHDYIDLQ